MERGTRVGGLRILIVESDRTLRELLTEFLRELGHEAISVSNSREALALLEPGQFDLMMVAYTLSKFDNLTDHGVCRTLPGLLPVRSPH